MKPGKELLFLALGGSGEIGMNVNLYGCEGKWVMVDLGLTFADPNYPGVELVLPDLAFIEENRADLLGIVLTHGHEDHIGAIPYLAARSRRAALRDAVHRRADRRQARGGGADRQGQAQHGRHGGRFPPRAVRLPLSPARPFDPRGQCAADRHALRPHLPHRRLEARRQRPSSATRRTEAELRAIGDAGVLALVCNSTNVFQEASSGSGARRPQGPRRRHPGRRGPGARHHLRLQRRPAARRWAMSRRIPAARSASPAARSTASCGLRRASAISRIFPEIIDFDTAMKLPAARGHDHRHGRAGREPRRARPHRLRPAQAQRSMRAISSSSRPSRSPATRSRSAASRTSWPRAASR